MSEIVSARGLNQPLIIVGIYQSGANTATGTLDSAHRIISSSVGLGSNLAARTLTLTYAPATGTITVGGLAAAAVTVAASTTTINTNVITSAAAFSTTLHPGASITGAGIPTDTYVTAVPDTSTMYISKNATASASITISLFDRILWNCFVE